MGKLILAGVLALALLPISLAGAQTRAQRLAAEARKVEGRMETSLNNIHEGAGTNCSGDPGYIHDIQRLNVRRNAEFRRHGMPPPSFGDYPTCGDSESGYGS